MNRENVKEQDKWDLTKIYQKIEEFEKEYSEVEEKIKKFSKYEKIINNGAKGLYQTLTKYLEISRKLEKLSVYTHLLFDQNTSDNQNQALKKKSSNLQDEFMKVSYFIIPTILKKDYKEIEQYYKEEPKLLEFEILLKNEFRYKEHTLSDDEEKLLSSISKMLNNNYETYVLLKDSDLTFGTIHDENGELVELTNANYSIYIESQNRKVRKETFQTLYKTYQQFINSFASTLQGNINENITISRIKKYESVINWCLFADELDVSIYNNLIKTIHDNLEVLFKYYDLKKQLLQVEELHLYDIYTPIVKDYQKKYSFTEAKETVLEALSILGNDYIETLKQGIEDRWIDVYPTKSKRTGAYSSGCYDTNPYILLNYQEKYNDMSTLAHEARKKD